MNPPVPARKLLFLDVVDSTQNVLCKWVREGNAEVGAVVASEQTDARGRFGRSWYTQKGSCLAMSLALYEYADWHAPQLLGMAVALAAAYALDCDLAWPNDLVLSSAERLRPGPEELVQFYRKVGGVLTELAPTPNGGHVPVVGIGINLTVEDFPDDLGKVATSLVLAGRPAYSPEDAASLILERMRDIPEPDSWADLRDAWSARDQTVGKRYRVPDGRIGVAEGIGETGHLLVSIQGEGIEVPSAEPTIR